jgi:hypothetical protein
VDIGIIWAIVVMILDPLATSRCSLICRGPIVIPHGIMEYQLYQELSKCGMLFVCLLVVVSAVVSGQKRVGIYFFLRLSAANINFVSSGTLCHLLGSFEKDKLESMTGTYP